MDIFQAIILGAIQGITEFLPVSSSGHLELTQSFLGITPSERHLFFNLCCHLGTTMALCYAFFPEIKRLWGVDRRRGFQLLIATLPLFPLVLIIKPLKNFLSEPQYLGPCFLITALILYCGVRFGKEVQPAVLKRRWWQDALIIGTSQGIALCPGISRSGATISVGRVLGWSTHEAVLFSFFLSIPTVLGGLVLELYHLVVAPSFSQAPGFSLNLGICCLIAFITAALVGSLSIKMMMKLVMKGNLIYFAWYCGLLGVLTFISTL